MRVYEYAKLNSLTSAEVLEATETLKIEATAAASGLSDAEAVVLDVYFKKLADIAAKPAKQPKSAKKPKPTKKPEKTATPVLRNPQRRALLLP